MFAPAASAAPTFAPASNIPTGSGPVSPAIADFNEDGDLDLAVAITNDDKVEVRLGNGDGTFASATDFPVGDRPDEVVVADINLDSNVDLLVPNSGFTDSTISILLGDGLGGFVTSSVSLAPKASIIKVAVGLIDGDANPDLAVTNSEPGGAPDNLSILLGNGDGTFDPPTITGHGGANPNGVAIAFLDGDPFRDLVVMNNASHNFAVLLGDGLGGFGPPTTYSTGNCFPDCSPGTALVKDFDNDGFLDVVTEVGFPPAGSVSVSLGNGDGTFDPFTLYSTGGSGPNGTATADFDSDGNPDLATSNVATGDASVLTGNGDGSFDPGVVFPTGATPVGIAAGDFNGDGRPDLAVANLGGDSVSILLNTTPPPDTTDPTISITTPPNKARYELHESVTPSYNCTDPDPPGPEAPSGIDSCTDNGIDTELPLGPKLFTVTATDNAGNTTTLSHAYTVDPPKYGDLVDDNDPLAYYRLNEPPGSSAMLDSSGNGHHGTYQNDVALGRQGAIACERRPHPPRSCELAADPENKAGYFSGLGSHGYVNGISAPSSAYTMEAWVKPRVNGAMMIMGHGGAGQLYRQTNGRLALRQTQDVVADTNAGGFQVLTTGQWWHVAATWNGSQTRLYVNGVLVQTSNAANKPPSGSSTFYLGYGEMAPWFHGDIDEAAYYGQALTQHDFEHRYATGTAFDHPSLTDGNHPHNTEGPFTDPTAPKNGGLYAPTKTPDADFACTDPDDGPPGELDDIASCTATVTDGGPPAPIADGDPLPDSLGVHTFTVTATDKGGNVYVHTHTYEVRPFAGIYANAADGPIAYYRLGDPAGSTVMADSGPGDHDGEYKNRQDQGPIGISGDGDTAREFFGSDGYGYANGIAAPRYQGTLEAWVDPDSLTRKQSIVDHGDAGALFIQNGKFRFRHMDKTVIAAVGPHAGFTHVAGTWDGVDLRIYVDGILQGTAEATKRPSSASTFYVGYGELAPWFDGSIDEVAYYSTALNANRVYQHFLADPPPDIPDGEGPDPDEEGGGGDPGGGAADPGEDTGGDDGGTLPDTGAGEGGGGADEPGEAGEDTNAELQKCLKNARKIANKKKRNKAIKRCRSRHG